MKYNMTSNEIEQVFSMLQLDTPQQRDKYKSMFQNDESGSKDAMFFWLTGTTEEQDYKDKEEASHA